MPYNIKYGVPSGVRTRVAALKGRRPRPLDDGDLNSRVCCVKKNIKSKMQNLFFFCFIRPVEKKHIRR